MALDRTWKRSSTCECVRPRSAPGSCSRSAFLKMVRPSHTSAHRERRRSCSNCHPRRNSRGPDNHPSCAGCDPQEHQLVVLVGMQARCRIAGDCAAEDILASVQHASVPNYHNVSKCDHQAPPSRRVTYLHNSKSNKKGPGVLPGLFDSSQDLLDSLCSVGVAVHDLLQGVGNLTTRSTLQGCVCDFLGVCSGCGQL